MAPQITKPWLICGDFNAMLYPQDKMSESPVLWAEIKDFSDCYHNLLVNELPRNGEYYTWSNKQLGSARVCSRLDRALGNDE